MEELLENIGLALGGTTVGAYFVHVLRLRHNMKALFLSATGLLAGCIARFRGRHKKNVHD